MRNYIYILSPQLSYVTGWPAEAEAALRATGGKSDPNEMEKNDGKKRWENPWFLWKNMGKPHGFYKSP